MRARGRTAAEGFSAEGKQVHALATRGASSSAHLAEELAMKRRMHGPILPLAALLLFAAGCASIAPTPEIPADVAGHADSSAAWTRLDTDGNGYLDQDELWQQRALALMQDFGGADANQDARVSRAEWERWWPRLDRSARHSGFVAPGVAAAPR